MNQPAHVRYTLKQAWCNVHSGYWIVHTPTSPDGRIYEAGRGYKPYLETRAGKRCNRLYFNADTDLFSGPFDTIAEAMAWRDNKPTTPVIGTLEELRAICEGRR